MDAAARLRGSLQTPASLFANQAAAGPKPGKELTIIRTDRQQFKAAKGPAVTALISPAARALEAQDGKPLARKAGKDEPRAEKIVPAANENVKPGTPTHMPEHVGPRDVAIRVQGFGGLNVRSSTGGPKLTSGD